MRWVLGVLCLFLPATLSATCRVADVLRTLRPGALWSIRGETYDDIEWQDGAQTKPTRGVVLTAISTCVTDENQRSLLRAQARLIVKDDTKTDAERLRAMILLLDYDR